MAEAAHGGIQLESSTILDILGDLDDDEFREFRRHLRNPTNHIDDFRPLSKRHAEDADRMQIATLILQNYPEDHPEILIHFLNKVKRPDLAAKIKVPFTVQYNGTGSDSNLDVLRQFKWRGPQALGAVEIVVGGMLFLFGVVSLITGWNLSVYSGVFAWAPLFYIFTGSVTVAADRSLMRCTKRCTTQCRGRCKARCMIKASMVVNILTSVVSLAATILYGLEAGGVQPSYIKAPTSVSMGGSGVQCVFNALVFVISICVSAFACEATCQCP